MSKHRVSAVIPPVTGFDSERRRESGHSDTPTLPGRRLRDHSTQSNFAFLLRLTSLVALWDGLARYCRFAKQFAGAAGIRKIRTQPWHAECRTRCTRSPNRSEAPATRVQPQL